MGRFSTGAKDLGKGQAKNGVLSFARPMLLCAQSISCSIWNPIERTWERGSSSTLIEFEISTISPKSCTSLSMSLRCHPRTLLVSIHDQYLTPGFVDSLTLVIITLSVHLWRMQLNFSVRVTTVIVMSMTLQFSSFCSAIPNIRRVRVCQFRDSNRERLWNKFHRVFRERTVLKSLCWLC